MDTSGPGGVTASTTSSHAAPPSSSVTQTLAVKVPPARYVWVPATTPPAAGTVATALPSPQSMVAVWVSAAPASVNVAIGSRTRATPPWAVVSATATTAGATLVTFTVAAAASVVHAATARRRRPSARTARAVVGRRERRAHRPGIVEARHRAPGVGQGRRVDVADRRRSGDVAPSATVVGTEAPTTGASFTQADGDVHQGRRRGAARIGDVVREGVDAAVVGGRRVAARPGDPARRRTSPSRCRGRRRVQQRW